MPSHNDRQHLDATAPITNINLRECPCCYFFNSFREILHYTTTNLLRHTPCHTQILNRTNVGHLQSCPFKICSSGLMSNHCLLLQRHENSLFSLCEACGLLICQSMCKAWARKYLSCFAPTMFEKLLTSSCRRVHGPVCTALERHFCTKTVRHSNSCFSGALHA